MNFKPNGTESGLWVVVVGRMICAVIIGALVCGAVWVGVKTLAIINAFQGLQ